MFTCHLIWDFRIKESGGDWAQHRRLVITSRSRRSLRHEWQACYATVTALTLNWRINVCSNFQPLHAPVGGCARLCDRETASEWRKSTCTQITWEREWMWQLWHTHDRGNAANCLSDSLSPTAGLCRERMKGSRRWLGDKGEIHSLWQTGLAVMYSLCMSVLSACPSPSKGHVVSVSSWPSVSGSFLPAHILLPCLCVFVSLTSMVSTPICSPAERSKFPSLLRYSYLSKQIHTQISLWSHSIILIHLD